MQELETELPTGRIRKQVSVMGVTTETNGITCPTTLQTVEDHEWQNEWTKHNIK